MTNYISVRVWDTAGTTTTLVDAFYVLKDTAGPSVAISTPTSSSFPSSLSLIGGTAASLFGVQGTEVSVQQGGGFYWNGFNFLSASPVWMAAAGTTAWSLTPGIGWVNGTTYQVVARSSTTFNLYSTTYATSTFTFDSSTPTVAVTAPPPDSTVSTLASIGGTAADAGGSASGLASVEVRLRRNTDGRWWNWFTNQWVGVAVSTVASGTSSWLVTPSTLLKSGLDSGTSYFIAVRASDNALPANQGDFFAAGSTFTWQDVTAPSAIADLATAAGSTPGHLNLTWTARGDDGATGLVLTGQYRIFYSTDIAAVPSTGTAQVVLSTSLVNPGDAQSRLLTGLNPGVTYYLHVAMADSDGNWSAFSNQATDSAAPAPTDQINGHVVNLSTEGITAVQVDCWDAADVLVATTFTLADGSGTFSIGGLTPGNYKLKVTWTVNGVSSSLWQDGISMGASGVDFVLEINYALATLTGTLGTLTTASVGGGGLGVSSLQSAVSNSNSRVELYQRGRQVSMVQVQPSGRWTIPSLLPGRYSVRAYTGLAYTDFQDVDLAEGEFKTLGFVFDPLPEASVFAFPNPARTSTTIRFVTVLAPLEAQVLIFDIGGHIVREFPGSQITGAAAPP
ncbi:MAG: carboxypeptidase-like regulatory domain-containing protein, partial [Actinomycetota bacterium]